MQPPLEHSRHSRPVATNLSITTLEPAPKVQPWRDRAQPDNSRERAQRETSHCVGIRAGGDETRQTHRESKGGMIDIRLLAGCATIRTAWALPQRAAFIVRST